MLKELHISNYVLINDLHLIPSEGINIITGETGAGKSIILGAISLLTGTRADKKTLHNSEKKCFIEGFFSQFNPIVNKFLQEHDIDIEDHLIIRREISPSGKSRAFINDTPAKLDLLKELAPLLLDIHSQHQTLLLKSSLFQLNILDGFANTAMELQQYKQEFETYKTLGKELNTLIESQKSANQEYDYNNFLYEELKEAQLDETDNQLEVELNKLENVESIKTTLVQSQHFFNDEQYGIVTQLQQVHSAYKNLEKFSNEYTVISDRINSLIFDVQDIQAEIESQNEGLLYDHEKAFELKGRVDLINKLYLKHHVNSVEELLQIQNSLEQTLFKAGNLDDSILHLETKIQKLYSDLLIIAQKLSDKRSQVIPDIESKIKIILRDLGMENASLTIQHERSEVLEINGVDDIQFLCSANRGAQPSAIHEVASGGEFSRLMFALKYLSAKHTALPTIIFDEIDSGISGEIALKMSLLMERMGEEHQLLIITHLPQIASKGKKHFYVYKDHSSEKTTSYIKLLTPEERVKEIAQMLSGSNTSDSARNIAKELLGFN